jgi:hypothetical protein
MNVATMRLFLHVLGATVWVGGQVALGGVVPVIRRVRGIETARAAARRVQLIAWPAFALLVGTGIWNLFAVDVGDQSSAYLRTLMIKLLLVTVSGLGALGHILSVRRRPTLGGVLAGICSPRSACSSRPDEPTATSADLCGQHRYARMWPIPNPVGHRLETAL